MSDWLMPTSSATSCGARFASPNLAVYRVHQIRFVSSSAFSRTEIGKTFPRIATPLLGLPFGHDLHCDRHGAGTVTDDVDCVSRNLDRERTLRASVIFHAIRVLVIIAAIFAIRRVRLDTAYRPSGRAWQRDHASDDVQNVPHVDADPPDDAVTDAPIPAPLGLGDDVLIDITSRYNESVVSNIDAIDTALVTILALPVAFAVFAVDKIRDLAEPWESLAIAFLLLCALGASIGYAWGVFIGGRRNGIQDGMIPRRFLLDYAIRGPSAIVDAIHAVTAAGEQNSRVRLMKRVFAGGALLFFMAGATTVFVARLGPGDSPRGSTAATSATPGPSRR